MAEIRNPNQQGGGQDSNSILMFTSLFLIVFLGLQYFRQPKKPAEPQNAAKQTAAAHTGSAAAIDTASAPTLPDRAPGVANVAANGEQTTVVENELYRITFTNRGAQVKSWILKKYKNEEGNPLDLVNGEAAARYGYPLSLYTYDGALKARFDGALFKPSATGTVAAPGEVSFEYAAGGLEVRKTFRFDTSYVIHAEVSATLNGAPLQTLLAWPSGFGDQQTLPQYASGMLDVMQNGKNEQTAAKKVSGGATLHGPFDWAGVSDLYFASVFLPERPEDATFVSLHNTVSIPRNRKKPEAGQTDQASVLGAAMGGAGSYSLRVFAGPKSLDVLSSIKSVTGVNLEKTVSFGWWGIIAKPLFLVLRFFHERVVANWGWAILLLTLILNVAMLPTRFQMMKSSLKMQRLQPQMDQIKQKYAKFKATDPRRQEMNKEIFDLQKREGVNMFGSCIPMLLQWPLLFGFYRMLSNVIELRQAHWLWLPDLAAPDPYHILPVFFIISMFLVQYLTPSPGVDPAQQKMMAFTMPAVFGFMTWNIGSGLALYWACSNVLGIVQQMAMNRTSLGREMRAIAARRAAKRIQKGR